MTTSLAPGEYLDRLYAAGMHIVLLHVGDDLYDDAIEPYRRVARHMANGERQFWTCRIRTVDDSVAVQACRFPQYRLFRDGCETSQHVGVLDDDELVRLIEEQA